MTCEDHQRGISAMMDARREVPEAASLFSHMAGCTECRGFFFAGRSIASALAREPAFPAALDRAIRRELSSAGRRPALPRVPRAWTAVLTTRVRVPAPALGLGAVLLLMLVLRIIGVPAMGGSSGDSVVYVPTLPEVRVEAVALNVNNR